MVEAAAQTQSYYYEGMYNRYDGYGAEREYPNNNNYEPSEYPSYSQDYNREYPLENSYKSKDSSNTIIKLNAITSIQTIIC